MGGGASIARIVGKRLPASYGNPFRNLLRM